MEIELDGVYYSSKAHTEVIREKIISWFNKRKRKGNYVSLLKKYSPIDDIKLNENINIYEAGNQIIIENIVLNFKINNNWVPWSHLSDGTIRLFHIITEVIFNDSNIILIEEPELGIHPNQLFKIMDFLNLQSQKKQIVISTHSPITLDVISPDELDHIIIAKMTKKGTVLSHLNAKQKSKAKAYIAKVGNLSAYWLHSDLEQ
jgi:predicted ATP-dependent endonuclease of OLD family